ncbi:hypothetical protein ZOSMA_356G00070 [Zostera marina]|uniref:Uncharacterized protein n=1 Tax=Zostera marina TaxID=29655 RepID=A0A0K9P8T9_ZOSMR|nr:hypothetical protein ZOSMA_356G00070 [Zostera marina]
MTLKEIIHFAFGNMNGIVVGLAPHGTMIQKYISQSGNFILKNRFLSAISTLPGSAILIAM